MGGSGFLPMGGKPAAGRALFANARSISTAPGQNVKGRFIKAGADACEAAHKAMP